MTGTSVSKNRKAECFQCGGIRNCDVKGKYNARYHGEYVSGCTVWRILECRGCKTVFVQTVSTNREDYENFYEENGSEGTRHIEAVNYWPGLSRRQRPDWMSDNGISDVDVQGVEALDRALVELYGALDNDLRILAGIGIRTAYDIASEILGIDPEWSFGKKLDALVTENLISLTDKGRLEAIVDAGSASAHRGWQPETRDLATMMDVLEHFIYETFVVPARKTRMDVSAAKMKGTVPPRRPNKIKAAKKAVEKEA